MSFKLNLFIPKTKTPKPTWLCTTLEHHLNQGEKEVKAWSPIQALKNTLRTKSKGTCSFILSFISVNHKSGLKLCDPTTTKIEWGIRSVWLNLLIKIRLYMWYGSYLYCGLFHLSGTKSESSWEVDVGPGPNHYKTPRVNFFFSLYAFFSFTYVLEIYIYAR